MRDLVLAVLLGVGACRAAPPAPQAPSPAPMTAQEAYAAKQYARCAELFTAAADQGGPSRGDDYYSAARCYVLDGKVDQAFASLELALKHGFHDPHIDIDQDFAPLRSDARYAAAWQAVRTAYDAAQANVREPQLRDELLALEREDQDVRMAWIASEMKDDGLKAKMVETDHKTSARLKEVIATYGWPGKTLVGEQAAHAAWLLIQHGDADRAFQKQCLALIEKAAQAGEASKGDYAYLYDRVAVADKRLQRFGTQYKDGKPAPMEDEARIDERRRAVGLGTMAEYDAQMRAMYGKKLDGKK